MVKSQGIPSCSTNKSPSAARSRGSCHERDDILSIDGIDGSCSSSIRSLQPEANREADSWNTGCANLTAKIYPHSNIHGKSLRSCTRYNHTRKTGTTRVGEVYSSCSRKGLGHGGVICRRRSHIHCSQRVPVPAGIRVDVAGAERVIRQQVVPAGHAEGGGARVGPDGIDFCWGQGFLVQANVC